MTVILNPADVFAKAAQAYQEGRIGASDVEKSIAKFFFDMGAKAQRERLPGRNDSNAAPDFAAVLRAVPTV